MRGYCLVSWKMGTIYSVNLIPDVEGISPEDVIKDYCRKYAVLFFPVDYWDEHNEEIEWFAVRDGERLEKIKWPSARNVEEDLVIKAIRIHVYRAFEILQVDYEQALEALDNQVITRALSLGWQPRGLGSALSLLSIAMEEKDQAEAYREEIMDMIEDVLEAVAATESIYENEADEFLEEEGTLKSGPKALKDMTDEELIEEATQLHNVIYADDVTNRAQEFFADPTMVSCFGSDNIIRFHVLQTTLICRGYEVRLSPRYSVQKQKEE